MAAVASFLTSKGLNWLIFSNPNFPDAFERLACYDFWVPALFMSGGIQMISL